MDNFFFPLQFHCLFIGNSIFSSSITDATHNCSRFLFFVYLVFIVESSIFFFNKKKSFSVS